MYDMAIGWGIDAGAEAPYIRNIGYTAYEVKNNLRNIDMRCPHVGLFVRSWQGSAFSDQRGTNRKLSHAPLLLLEAPLNKAAPRIIFLALASAQQPDRGGWVATSELSRGQISFPFTRQNCFCLEYFARSRRERASRTGNTKHTWGKTNERQTEF